MSEQGDIEHRLAKIADDLGAGLHVENQRPRNVAPLPIRTADGSFVNRRCPRCCFDQFAHSHGDELCRCAGCGATLDIDELATSTDLGREIEQFEAALRGRFGDEHELLFPGPRGMIWFQAATRELDSVARSGPHAGRRSAETPEEDPDPSFPSPKVS